jgi:polyhydroxybutyrate depolymerase
MPKTWISKIGLFTALAMAACATQAGGLASLEITVADVKRTALVQLPVAAKGAATPVVFVFHGHGGSARQAARSFALEREWPEAIVVYMQGLKTPGKLTDPNGKLPGWQLLPGQEGDRDLKFFDAVLAQLKKDHPVDAKRVYATGHSNGGGFTYLLWQQRAEVFAAVAPSAAAVYAWRLPPKPALIIGGEADPLVKFVWQERTIRAVRDLNGCASKGEAWANRCTLYPSTNGTPLVTFIYPGGHEFNREAPRMIVKFFQEHPGEAAKPPTAAGK